VFVRDKPLQPSLVLRDKHKLITDRKLRP